MIMIMLIVYVYFENQVELLMKYIIFRLEGLEGGGADGKMVLNYPMTTHVPSRIFEFAG